MQSLRALSYRERIHAVRITFQSVNPPQVLVSTKWRALTMLVIGSVFVASGILILASGNLFGLLAIAFFGLGLYFAIGSLRQPPRLTLNDREFKFDAPRRHSTYEYRHCSDFRTMSNIGILNPTLIVFGYNGPQKPPRFGRRVSAGGVRLASVPSIFRMSPNELADLLNARRAADRPRTD